ncbi:C4-dicarboxylate ABC transporter substrate-binding protein [Halomonas heilongjiangensis]|uniref:C4-dicarboxylate ABC transporter substrate-binding protein n=1 Tax=Halomonas heilongjiangensis TaxID=1387883 RepID=A0A2N7TT91_9GAMM|nr:C4-dicarboxylate ABC transporter substrate-binding protein [Halomonas heilongjiangensis]PXX88680.1 C4-dicarboxylate ABC transporter substrate-binding protein [Halomonas heilongjiangensis]
MHTDPRAPRCAPARLVGATCLVGLLAGLPIPGSLVADEGRIIIGTASPAGVYHVTGRTLCRLLESPCTAQTSDGSAANLQAIRQGEVTIALAQSDLQHYAVSGIEGFSDAGPDDSLRSLFSVHGEPFTLVVRRDSGIREFDDLRQRAVNVGNPGSGQRGTMMTLLEAKGWTLDDFSLANDLPADQQSLELCHGNVDAMVYTVGHPNASIEQAIRLCDAAIIDVGGEAVDRLVEETPYFTRATIPASIYTPDQPAVETFGVRATLVASAATDPEIIHTIVTAVFDDLDHFKSYHPAYGELTVESMITEGLSAPLHEGALRYYRERGWIEADDATEEETSDERDDEHEETAESAAPDEPDDMNEDT